MRLLFVCSGNICRSPMAEGLAAQLGAARGLDLEVASASTLGLRDRPAHPHAIAVCREVGVDLRSHRSQPLTAELIAHADAVLVMEIAHAVAVRALAPEIGEGVQLLGPYAGVPEIDDPLGGWRSRYRTTRDLLTIGLTRYLDRVAHR